jgi:hypothetical protein
MSLRKIALGIVAAAAAFSAPVAIASEPYAPEPVVVGSKIHGFGEVKFATDYITPRGLWVTNTGLTTQILTGVAVDLYKGPGLISNVSLAAGIWNDLWSEQNDPKVGRWNEFDWFVGLNFSIGRDWRAGIQFIQFLSPTGAFAAESNIEFSLAYNDSKSGFPISLNPYAKLFYAVSGDSTVVFGKKGGTYDVELGIVPTYTFKGPGAPITLTAPTWVTVGPSTYWNRGVSGCGLPNTPCDDQNAGVFSTGLTAKMPLAGISPAYGNWSVHAGFQYYHILNDTLLLAQTATGTAASFADADRDIWVGFAGVGVSW